MNERASDSKKVRMRSKIGFDKLNNRQCPCVGGYHARGYRVFIPALKSRL